MKNYTLTMALAAMALTMNANARNISAAEQTTNRVMVCVSSFGDFMGDVPNDKLTAQRLYFYNTQMQVVALVETAAAVNSDSLITQYYNPYIYDENGNLVKKDRYQYGLYDYGDRAMRQSSGVVEYKYDAEGNCIEMIEGQKSVAYEYDADGNCVKEVNYINGKKSKTLEYQDFSAGKNLPALVISSHVQESYTGEFYEESREYNEYGQIVKALRICNRDYEENYGAWSYTTAYGDFMQEEHWTYDGRQLLLFEKFTNQDEETGELIPYLKTVYTVKDANTVGYQSYTAMDGEWYKSGIYQEATYCDFDELTASASTRIMGIERAAGSVNDARVMFAKPGIAETAANLAFAFYRNGERVNVVELKDLDEEDGLLVYTDAKVPSGDYDYMVQVLKVEDGEKGKNYLDAFTSEIVPVGLTVDLPAVTNVGIIASVKDDNNDNYVTIHFTVPDASEDLGFISHELIVNNAQVGADTTYDHTVEELHCTLTSDKATVFILTRYAYGKVASESVKIDVNDIPVQSIGTVFGQDGGQVEILDLNGNHLDAPLHSLHGNYLMKVGKNTYKLHFIN